MIINLFAIALFASCFPRLLIVWMNYLSANLHHLTFTIITKIILIFQEPFEISLCAQMAEI